MKTFFCSTGAQHQLVPTGLHQSLIAEQAIQTFKHNFIARLSSCDPKLPLHLWCCLIWQAVLTLNLLCPKESNPWLLVESFLNGAFDFNLTPLPCPVTEAQIFEGPGDQRNFFQHGLEVWYLGTYPELYICYTVYVPEICSDRVAKTIKLSPHKFLVPVSSSTNSAHRKIEDLSEEARTHPCHLPFLLGMSKSWKLKHFKK